jgi:hypothetical protein
VTENVVAGNSGEVGGGTEWDGPGDAERLGDVELTAGDMTLCVGEGMGVGVVVAVLPHPAVSMTAATITASAAAIILVFTGLIYPCAIVLVCEVWWCTTPPYTIRNHSAGRRTSRPPTLTRRGQPSRQRAGGSSPGWWPPPLLLDEERQPCTMSIIACSSRMASARCAVFRATPSSCMRVVMLGSHARARSSLVILSRD